MATTRYEVPPGGGFYVDVPGIWQGGEVIEVDDETREVTVISGPHDEEAASPAPPSDRASETEA